MLYGTAKRPGTTNGAAKDVHMFSAFLSVFPRICDVRICVVLLKHSGHNKPVRRNNPGTDGASAKVLLVGRIAVGTPEHVNQ